MSPNYGLDKRTHTRTHALKLKRGPSLRIGQFMLYLELVYLY